MSDANPVLIGLDVGTTGTKAVAFDLAGAEIAANICPTPTTHLGNGRAEHDPEALWLTAAGVLRDVCAQLNALNATPIALGCSSMAEAGVLLDAHGTPTYPIIPWFDVRTTPQIEWWNQEIGSDQTAAISGVVPHPMFGLPKLMWIRDNEPEAFAAGRRWLNIADYIEYRLCGSMSTDYSLASRTLVLDLVNKQWSGALLEAVGIDDSLLAELRPAGSHIGDVHDVAAGQTALPVGLPVGRGGQDHVCAAYGLDITEPGMILDSIGTAEAFFAVRSAPDMTGRLWPDELNQGVHVAPDLFYVMTGTGDGAGRIDAHREALGVEFDSYLQAAQEPGPEREMIESLAIDGQLLFEKMAAAAAPQPVRHIATGGGARIALLMQRKRELGGRRIETSDVKESTCKGAARLAGDAIGVPLG